MYIADINFIANLKIISLVNKAVSSTAIKLKFHHAKYDI